MACEEGIELSLAGGAFHRSLPRDRQGSARRGVGQTLSRGQAAQPATDEGGPETVAGARWIDLFDLEPELREARRGVEVAGAIGAALTGQYFVAREAAKHMLKAGRGRIVIMASQAALVGLDGHAAYAASKAGLLGMLRSMAVGWGPRGVTVNAISPTVVDTEMTALFWGGEIGERARAEILGRFAKPREIASPGTSKISSSNLGMKSQQLLGPIRAVRAALKRRPGLILSDIQLADGSSGLDAVNEILVSQEVPVIFITGYPELFLAGQAPELAFLITKPFTVDSVKAVISQALFFKSKGAMEKAAEG